MAQKHIERDGIIGDAKRDVREFTSCRLYPAGNLLRYRQSVFSPHLRRICELCGLNVQAGDKIDFIVDESGAVICRPATVDTAELKGILKRKGQKPVSISDMKRVVKERFRKA
jgi:hypothetical protein